MPTMGHKRRVPVPGMVAAWRAFYLASGVGLFRSGELAWRKRFSRALPPGQAK